MIRPERITFFDLETQQSLEDVNGERVPISCGVMRRDKVNHYYDDSEKSIAGLVEDLKKSDLIVTYNGIAFDNKVLLGYSDFDFTAEIPQYDILVEIQKILGRRVTLDHVIKCNLPGFSKQGSGEQALIWWKRILRCQEEQRRATIEGLEEERLSWYNKEKDIRMLLFKYCASDVEALARIMGNIVIGIPVKVQKYWENMQLVDIHLPNPLVD